MSTEVAVVPNGGISPPLPSGSDLPGERVRSELFNSGPILGTPEGDIRVRLRGMKPRRLYVHAPMNAFVLFFIVPPPAAPLALVHAYMQSYTSAGQMDPHAAGPTASNRTHHLSKSLGSCF